MIKGFIPNNPTARPLIDPTTMQNNAPHINAFKVPDGDLTLTINAAPAAIIAIDRSIPPVSMQIVWPAASRPSGAASAKVTPTAGIEKKYGSIKLVSKNKPIRIPTSAQIDLETLTVAKFFIVLT
jgi:hypothetical protein